jgi:hypothetical protein
MGSGIKHGDSCCCSGGGVSVPGCPCPSTPATLFMHVNDPTKNNGIFQPCTLQYGPTPAPLLPVVLATDSYLSTAPSFDPVLMANFYTYLTCYLGAYVITRVYITSPLGSPFRDRIRYTWFVGLPGNTCSPFSLALGSIFEGGDATEVVTIDAIGPP